MIAKEMIWFSRKALGHIDIVNGSQEPVSVFLCSNFRKWFPVQAALTELVKPQLSGPLSVLLFQPYSVDVQLAEVLSAFLFGLPLATTFMVADNQAGFITGDQVDDADHWPASQGGVISLLYSKYLYFIPDLPREVIEILKPTLVIAFFQPWKWEPFRNCRGIFTLIEAGHIPQFNLLPEVSLKK